ncbi:unnamed protein product [Penicillium pancosmium]
MKATIKPPMVVPPFLDAPIDPKSTLNPAHQWSNSFDASHSDYLSPIPNFQEQKSQIETTLQPTQSYKPQKQPCRKPSKSTAYISRENLSPDRVKHLERNRIAANKCRMKKMQEHKGIQSALDVETAKRQELLAEIRVLKEDIWQLKNRVLQHAAKCDDQDINQQWAQMTQNKIETNSATIHCPSPSFSVSTMSDGSMEKHSQNLFDSFVDFTTM